MHVVSHSTGGGAGGGSMGGSHHNHAKKNFHRMKSSSNIKADSCTSKDGSSKAASKKNSAQSKIPDLLKSGKIEKDPSGKKTVYRVGKQKFTLDGRDGKTLDDIIEVKSSGYARLEERVLFSFLKQPTHIKKQ